MKIIGLQVMLLLSSQGTVSHININNKTGRGYFAGLTVTKRNGFC